jgi:hypothetical protein
MMGVYGITRKTRIILVMNNGAIVILRQSRRILPIHKGKDPSLMFRMTRKAYINPAPEAGAFGAVLILMHSVYNYFK